MNNLISVLIPSHNREDTILKAVNSVIEQTYIGDIECIIVDSTKNDSVQNIVENYKKTIKKNNRRILFYKNQLNEFPYSNWVELSTLFKGDYVKFLCNDDWLEVNAIETMVSELKKNNLSCVVSNINLFKQNETSFHHYDLNRNINKNKIIDSVLELDKTIPITQSAVLMTAEGFSKAFEFSLKNFQCTKNLLGEDLLFTYYHFFKDQKATFLNLALCNSKAVNDSITRITPRLNIDFCNINSIEVLLQNFKFKLTRKQKKRIRHLMFMYYLIKFFTRNSNYKYYKKTRFIPFPEFKEFFRYLLKK